MLTIVLVVLQVISSIGMVVFILIHSGKGGGLSDMLGGTLNATAAGSTVAERNLDRITVLLGLVFVFTSVALAIRLNP
ncbi:preprotein translocase subunit SecG [Ferrithrix thermotolerans DSM 19514]|uniref:Protein-export membrane protein SecG n=1 Tax=Ferrithrix thermotolerans DSM 19514 TaxID=1121881 RepID=A0A1M4SBZ6_9ACTN|nr:preprotein translocase subunit SecG [Ferrithrix thermotolerans]SHE29744.1 preprotein translocase subunit SecG [Ferrithrix thermotolerans DSM 19514]